MSKTEQEISLDLKVHFIQYFYRWLESAMATPLHIFYEFDQTDTTTLA